MKQNLPEIDILATIAILLIVFVHLDNYIYNSFFINFSQEYVSIIGLTIFFFISGLKLNYNYRDISTNKKIKIFYKKRIVKIFPIYWLSLLGLYIILGYFKIAPGNISGYDFSYMNIVIHVFGLQGIFYIYHFQTLWFIGVILLYYLLYPLMIQSKNISIQICTFIVVFCFCVTSHFLFNIFISSFFIFFFVFCAGILFSEKSIIKEDMNKFFLKYSIILLVLSGIIMSLELFSYLILNKITEIAILTIFSLSLTIILYYSIKKILIFKNGAHIKFFSIISYSSLAIYLFHIQLLALFASGFKNLFASEIVVDLLIITIAGPLTILICYGIQYYIDKFIKKFAIFDIQTWKE
jgi:peptidoglycan/LPS O-acetylase OafA/YrhL